MLQSMGLQRVRHDSTELTELLCHSLWDGWHASDLNYIIP